MSGAKKVGKDNKRGKSDPSEDPAQEDVLLWKRVAESTKPLPGRKVAEPPAGTVPKKKSPKPAPAPPAGPPPERAPAPKAAPELRPGEARGLDKRTAERLRRGQLPLEARIDLHGQTQDEAHRALIAFIGASHAAGRRCVLVITGKGGPRGPKAERESIMPERERGILRRAVPRWLNEPDLRPLVLGFAQAQPPHGGAGALYVLLKRQR